jgi:hypothetical protein
MELRTQIQGWMLLPNGVKLEMKISAKGFDQHMESGIQVAQLCGFTQPMRVHIRYVYPNNFKLYVLGVDNDELGKSFNNPLTIPHYGDEYTDGDCEIVSDDDVEIDDSDDDVEIDDSEEEESDDGSEDVDGVVEDGSDADSDNVTEGDTDDDHDDIDGDLLARDLDPELCKVFNWRRDVSKALARHDKPQVLVCLKIFV